MKVTLSPQTIKTIEEILNSEKTVEIAIRRDKLIVWAVQSKKKIEQTAAQAVEKANTGYSQ